MSLVAFCYDFVEDLNFLVQNELLLLHLLELGFILAVLFD